jgi:hypothetical protein
MKSKSRRASLCQVACWVVRELRFGCVPVAVMAIGCQSSAYTPTTSTPPITYGGPPVPTGPFTISGAGTDGDHPVVGANVNAFIITNGFGYSYMWAHGAILTDVTGHFRMTGVPTEAGVWLQAFKDGYVQQCAAPEVIVHGDTTIDVGLVSKANVSASTIQPAAAGLRSVLGVIVEDTPTGKQPAAGAFVDFEPLEDFPAAVTNSDAGGRFLLCGLPQSDTVRLGASAGTSRVAYVNVPPDQTTDVEITLPSGNSHVAIRH